MKKQAKFKVVILDIDGVISPELDLKKAPSGHFPLDVAFSPTAVKNLKKILEVSGAKIVISSRWAKQINIQAIVLVLASHGITGPYVMPEDVGEKEILAREDWMSPQSFKLHGNSVTPKKMSSNKCEEIGFWLNDHSDKISGFVVLDDDWQRGYEEYQVTTKKEKGLTAKNVKEALAILDKGMSPYFQKKKKDKAEQEAHLDNLFNRNK